MKSAYLPLPLFYREAWLTWESSELYSLVLKPRTKELCSKRKQQKWDKRPYLWSIINCQEGSSSHERPVPLFPSELREWLEVFWLQLELMSFLQNRSVFTAYATWNNKNAGEWDNDDVLPNTPDTWGCLFKSQMTSRKEKIVSSDIKFYTKDSCTTMNEKRLFAPWSLLCSVNKKTTTKWHTISWFKMCDKNFVLSCRDLLCSLETKR